MNRTLSNTRKIETSKDTACLKQHAITEEEFYFCSRKQIMHVVHKNQ